MSQNPLFNLAPYAYWLNMPINPWRVNSNVYYGPVTYGAMESADIGTEKAIVEKVASYGRQLGRISEVIDVLLARADLQRLSAEEKRALEDYRELQQKIAALRGQHTTTTDGHLQRLERDLVDLKQRDPRAFKRVKTRLEKALNGDE